MINIYGDRGSAVIFTDKVEKTAIEQIQTLMNSAIAEESHTRIMPDVHAGAGCTIGTTMLIKDKVCPNLVGVDIGCGMIVAKINTKNELNFSEIDKTIRTMIPCGFDIYSAPIKSMVLKDLYCYHNIKERDFYFQKSIGSLGGGNHFIEIDIAENGDQFLIVHTGSRNLGKTVADYYQKLARMNCVEEPKSDLSYLIDELKQEYLYDMMRCQHYAALNRETIIETLTLSLPELEITPYNSCTHNFIDSHQILRKGAISANTGDFVYIPFNMRDGGVMGIVKEGNPEWNYSLPHGAGRIMGRNEAKRQLDLVDYQISMRGIYSSCVSENTIDESPMVYKPFNEIYDVIKDQLTNIIRVTPVYNFKAN